MRFKLSRRKNDSGEEDQKVSHRQFSVRPAEDDLNLWKQLRRRRKIGLMDHKRNSIADEREKPRASKHHQRGEIKETLQLRLLILRRGGLRPGRPELQNMIGSYDYRPYLSS
jgi:hypothetical protein